MKSRRLFVCLVLFMLSMLVGGCASSAATPPPLLAHRNTGAAPE